MALQSPILFPFGEDGFTPNMRYAGSAASSGNIRQTLSMRDYYSYQIQHCSRQGETLLRGGRLFQQFCVDVLSSVQEGELLWLDNHQNDIMADIYSNVRDLVHRGDVDVSAVGKRIILPASFTGSPRYLYQKYQDAMPICRAYGYLDLFITFTCNGNWPELQDALSFYSGLRPEDHPDLVAHVFHIKLRHFLDVLIKRGHFGPALAVTYTVEFQKRGLPHAHILLWLQPSAKLKTPADIDKYVSAEIPDPDEAVTSFMMHGPCGAPNPRAPCMEGQKCNKYFPKSFTQKTRIDSQGYPTYRRRDTGVFCVKSGVVLDNRFVVPHNVDLLVQFQAHINVEVCNQSRAIKYLFKYINKGPDRSRVVIESDLPASSGPDIHPAAPVNEIKAYLDCRYLCAYEACWRLFSFDIHFRQPSVLRLLVHLPDRHHVYFKSSSSTDAVLSRPDVEKTMFTEWMAANCTYPSAKKHLYAEFSREFVWHTTLKKWEPRRKGKCIGCVIQVNACAGDLYYLRLLLNVVRGPRSFEEIRTVRGILYPTFQAACKASGLLGNDREWNACIVEAAHSASSYELRVLFVMIVVFCQVHLNAGGRTAHSRFKIPLSIHQWSTCDIKRGTQLARLLQRTSLIVWDEPPMMHRHCIEALDRSLRDICGSVELRLRNQPFGGITVVFGGDLRQILPVIPGASRTDIICFTLYFGDWLLDLGDGKLSSCATNDDLDGSLIEIPSDLLIPFTGDPVEAIVNELYPDIMNNFANHAYLSQRAIVTPYNIDVDRINEYMLGLIPGTTVDYFSHDRVAGSADGDPDGRPEKVTRNVVYSKVLDCLPSSNHA
ncbi:DNA helicase PIF1, ATP-dependent [Corchorus olitorius]|uniref:ATP-dependent DNA helicase n=1 Tax=Corchorus olitorius TaxID=93759 RepID=A0A1R3FVM0_9ROSI|nr:DNA helicase PIF1, ATP-dependent [Corchorus olitorius]